VVYNAFWKTVTIKLSGLYNIVMIQRIKSKKMFDVMPLLLLAVAAIGAGQVASVKAWGGDGDWGHGLGDGCGFGCGFHHFGWFHNWSFGGIGCCGGDQGGCCQQDQNCCNDNVQASPCCDQGIGTDAYSAGSLMLHMITTVPTQRLS
jgi:hypothetical protein